MFFLNFVCRRRDVFESYLSINIASELPKIVGNDLRDLLYKQISEQRVFEDMHVDPRDFVLRAIEGKFQIMVAGHRRIIHTRAKPAYHFFIYYSFLFNCIC